MRRSVLLSAVYIAKGHDFQELCGQVSMMNAFEGLKLNMFKNYILIVIFKITRANNISIKLDQIALHISIFGHLPNIKCNGVARIAYVITLSMCILRIYAYARKPQEIVGTGPEDLSQPLQQANLSLLMREYMAFLPFHIYISTKLQPSNFIQLFSLSWMLLSICGH